MRKLWSIFAAVLCTGTVFAQPAAPPAPPALPSELPIAPAASKPAVAAPLAPGAGPVNSPAVRPTLPFQQRPIINQRPVGPRGPITRSGPAATQSNNTEEVLTWDATSKEYTAKQGELTAHFEFAVTNTSKDEVVINWVRPSCGCTAAKLPPTPWKLAPGDGGVMAFDMDLRGKFGVLSKYISVDTSHGQKLLNIRANIPAQTLAANPGVDRRTQNMQIALADRQAVFKKDCASCHSAPAEGQKGEKLFAAACAICHEAPHRATMVPDLKALQVATSKEYWTHWITHGKPGSLMPAFAKNQGGILSDEQIESLAEYLTHHYPAKKVASAPAGGGQ